MFDFLGDIGSAIMTPLYWITSVDPARGFHRRVRRGARATDSGAAWALSIIGLTLVIRAALIPLFVKQIKSSRNMQLLQPKVKELQKKYGHDRERLAQETMALYKETGTNPFASCLPILLQMPIFLALFRLIDQAAQRPDQRGVLTDRRRSTRWRTRRSSAPRSPTRSPRTDDLTSVRILAAVLVIAMTATTFLTQRQLMSKNMPADAMTGPYAQQQKMLLYVLPVVFAVGGIAFPIGVLLYWTTSNLWTMGQQFYVIRNNPAPGTPALRAKEERDAREGARARAAGSRRRASTPAEDAATPSRRRSRPRRQQPKKQSREPAQEEAATPEPDRSDRPRHRPDVRDARARQPTSPASTDRTDDDHRLRDRTHADDADQHRRRENE